MKLLWWTLFAVRFLTACSPASTPVPTTISDNVAPLEAPQPVTVTTSCDDKLEASDPASVKYGAGHPVLVEFFRFT
jgi:hypothetical protein